MEATHRFDLRERISGGVSAEVYRAYDGEHDRYVVIRILREGLDDEYVERFQRAAEDAADVRHANVVAVIDHGVIDGRPYLVRELVEGSTLDDLLARRGPLSEEESRRLAAQIATGLSAAHARGLLHRDLSAGSVIVTPDGTAKVADFAMPGAPLHPAPEQVGGQQVDERTDVYGLGAVLYQMLTGHVPRGRPASPRRLAPRVSRRIDAVAMRALEPDPGRRYPTAAAMADALRSATPPVRRAAPAAASLATAAPRSARPVVVPPARRRRSSMLPFALLALPLVALVVAGLLFARTQPTRTAVLSATTTPQAALATATVSPTAAATVSPELTSLPPVETTPEPTTEPTVAPTVAPTVPPPPPPPPPPAPPPQAAVPTARGDPLGTVQSFYDLVNRKLFDEAAALWSARMQASYPPATNVYGRFDRTRQIVIRGIAQSAEGAGAATVTVDLLETLDSGVTRHWVGQWQLVWDGTRWLMDAPNLRPA